MDLAACKLSLGVPLGVCGLSVAGIEQIRVLQVGQVLLDRLGRVRAGAGLHPYLGGVPARTHVVRHGLLQLPHLLIPRRRVVLLFMFPAELRFRLDTLILPLLIPLLVYSLAQRGVLRIVALPPRALSLTGLPLLLPGPFLVARLSGHIPIIFVLHLASPAQIPHILPDHKGPVPVPVALGLPGLNGAPFA